MKYLKYLLYILCPIILLYAIYKYFSSSDDDLSVIDKSILLLDSSFDRFGTDYDTIKSVISGLSKTELIALHSSFGSRLYHKAMCRYATGLLYPNFFVKGTFTVELDLNGLYDTELDSFQITELKQLYENKGLSYPMI